MRYAEIDAQLEHDLEAYWLPLLQTDGQWDAQKIRNELHDLVFVFEQVSAVYCTLTGGQLAKPMYYADVILSAVEDQIQDAVRAALAEAAGQAGESQ